MSYQAIIEYLQSLSQHYFQANKKEKGRLLDHAIKVTEEHRKSLIRSLNQNKPITNNKQNSGAKQKYSPELLTVHIEYLWNSIERVSAKRLKEAFKEWLPYYHDNNVTGHIKYLLNEMSVSTLDRFLRNIRKSSSTNKGISSTSPARYMKNKIPINTFDSTITRPGYTQADTVAHCGNKLIGDFMNSITLTDLATTWTENRAIFTKKAAKVKKALDNIQNNLPFALIAINTDSGSEFLNVPVFNMFKEKKVIFTRSRPYKKNDNCYVEQKNYTHVRELFGYQRIEEERLETLMNEIFIEYWNPLQNFFIPTFKLKEKIRIGAKIKKIYGKPQTPYQRTMDSIFLTEEEKENLAQKKRSLNPFKLKKELEKKLATFFNLLNEYNKGIREAA